jgi:hypothetical protein
MNENEVEEKLAMRIERDELSEARDISGPEVFFWIYALGGYVGLRLKPGERVRTTWGGPTEEGYAYTEIVCTHRGEIIERTEEGRSRDCDGLYENCAEYDCRVDMLDASVADMGDSEELVGAQCHRVPDWVAMGSSQRDHTAEAAGY